ncbi:MAG: hypothetical protein A2096_07895 [Spirochaetes bacterium GWF1_41_5]|nr:MAG: hypothetical protein A2096_07895 [Spirochaetes bacterium GWF1_41_5]HBE02703.1 hypothetical protein [Spirochaetia bacterium]
MRIRAYSFAEIIITAAVLSLLVPALWAMLRRLNTYGYHKNNTDLAQINTVRRIITANPSADIEIINNNLLPGYHLQESENSKRLVTPMETIEF